VLAAFCLGIQIVTGIFLAMFYVPNIESAFSSVQYIMRDVNYGWLIRYIHADGASLFFAVVYIHMLKGIYYGSYVYPRESVWYSGFLIFILLMATAFFGYILPWGQMSYWAATVITSLLSAIPYVGDPILIFIWGGVSVSQPMLTRVYTLHFLLPFIIIGLVAFHLIFLHEHGSNNPLGIKSVDNVAFYPYYVLKDLLGLFITYMIFFFLIFFMPNLLLHPDNYIMANPEITPLHIVPEWYFLLFYGILRSIPSKIGGIFLLVLALLCICFLPIISKPLLRSGSFRPLFKIIFWIFICNCIVLSWSASNPVETPFYEIGQLSTLFYFAFFLVLNPIINAIEKFFYSFTEEEVKENGYIKKE